MGVLAVIASITDVATFGIFDVSALCLKHKNSWDNPKPLTKKLEVFYMANRKRKIVLRCPVTEEERSLIEQKMALLPTSQIGAYLRKMAIDGFIIQTDTSNIKEFTRELQAIGNNVNQIAKRVNSTSRIYDTDIEEIKERLNEIWQLQRRVLLSLH